MKRTDISGKQMEATIALYLIGSSLVSSGATSAKQNTWFCILLSMILIIPLVWVQSKILKLYPGQNYFQNILRAMGRPAGMAVLILLLLYLVNLGALVMRLFSDFIHIVNMTETPVIAIMVPIAAALVYTLHSRIYVLARISRFVFPLLVLIVIVTIVMSYKDMHLSNLKPILAIEPKKLVLGTMDSIAIPYCEVVVCAPLFRSLNRRENIFPTFLKGVFFAFLVLLTADLRNSLVLGYSVEIYAFPSYEAVSVIQLGEFFTRIEVLIGINLLVAGFVKVGVLIFSTCEDLACISGRQDSRPLVSAVSLLLITLAILLYSNSVEIYWWTKLLPYFSFPFQIGLPVLVLIVGTIRKKKGKKKKQKKQEKTPVSAKPQEN